MGYVLGVKWRTALDAAAAEDFLFASYLKARPWRRGPDELIRRPELTATLLTELGSPQAGLPCLLVAGSKGKGSTAAFAATLLAAGGKRVGLFSSPHLLDVRERIRVGGQLIPVADFVALVERLGAVAGPLADRLPADDYFSPIGLLLCVALLHFRACGVELAVIEAGRGARFDDTRLVEHPVAAITRLMREHEHQLGPGLARIGWHKAGAIPAGGTAIAAPQRPAAMAALRAEAAAQRARLLVVGCEVRLKTRSDDSVGVETPRRRYDGLRPGLRGSHQAENLAVALAAAEALVPALAELPMAVIQDAVAGVAVPGRCQTLQAEPLVLLDGAINAASARAFLAVAEPISRPPIVAITAVPADKDFAGLARVLGPRVTRLYVTAAANPHLEFSPDAPAVAARYTSEVIASPSLAEAISAGLADIGQHGSLWIVGTQSLLADALRLWRGSEFGVPCHAKGGNQKPPLGTRSSKLGTGLRPQLPSAGS